MKDKESLKNTILYAIVKDAYLKMTVICLLQDANNAKMEKCMKKIQEALNVKIVE